MPDLKYSQRGVSAEKEDVHNAIKNVDKGIFPKAFCKVVPDILGGDADWCNIMHADGAGTKSALAYVYWRETGDTSVWRGIAQDAIVMNLDDLLCVGATDSILLSSTIGRNKNLIPGEVIAAIINAADKIIYCSENLTRFGNCPPVARRPTWATSCAPSSWTAPSPAGCGGRTSSPTTESEPATSSLGWLRMGGQHTKTRTTAAWGRTG